ncbi:MAG: hypothetical protein HYV95_17670 [Opitutae bacterium]|nr:hypothetical protein [Opitutae bacterium]
MHARGFSKAALALLTVLLSASPGPATAEDGAPPANPFGNVAPPRPAPGPEMEWVFNQPAPEARVRTAFDLERIEVESSLRAFREANAKLIGGVATKKSSPAAALNEAKVLLKDSQSQTTLATLRTRPELQTADGLQNLAAAAFASGRPLLALGGLWLAEERWPGNPDVRFNLASLLAQHGSVNEAQALLDDLMARQKLPAHPFGITAQQGADYLRAYIQTRQGRTREAAGLLKPIVAANPAFGEAALLFALVTESEEEARKAYRVGIWRRAPARQLANLPTAEAGPKAATSSAADPTPSSAEPPEPSLVGLDAALFVDLSKGQPGELPAIREPVDLQDWARFGEWVKNVVSARQNEEFPTLIAARDAHMERCRQKDLPWPVRERLMELENMIEPENARLAEIRTLNQALNRAIVDSTDAFERVFEQYTLELYAINSKPKMDKAKICAETIAAAEKANAAMRPHVQAVDLATRRLHRAWHRYVTALGSLTADPDFRAYLAAHLKLASNLSYNELLLNMAIHHFGPELSCLTPGKPSANELGKTEDATLANCSEEDAKKSVGAEVSSEIAAPMEPIDASVGIEATCDGISVEVGMELLKTAGLTAEAEFKMDGTCTLYLGPKITMGAGGAEASSKGGVYVTVNNISFQNPIQDAGVRSVVKTTVKAGLPGASATASYTGSDTRISLIAGPTVPAHNAGGLANFRQGK